MREILFRAKRVDNGEWVEGYFVQAAGIPFISAFAVRNPILVVAESVGEYTGLKDKNGKEIFEGDILKARYNDYPYIVSYEVCRFKIEDKWGNGIKMTQEAINWLDVEIVGNIHDNPELLEANNG